MTQPAKGGATLLSSASKMAMLLPLLLLSSSSSSSEAALRQKKVVLTFELVNGTWQPVVRQVEQEEDPAAISGAIIQVRFLLPPTNKELPTEFRYAESLLNDKN